MKHRKLIITILIIVAAAAIAAAAIVMLWMRGAFLPSWVSWQTKESKGASLRNRRLHFADVSGETVWDSGADLLVQDFLWADIDHDGEEELLVLCWKIGRYGRAVPMVEKKDGHSWSQHIYIYKSDNGNIRPVWMASDIGLDAQNWRFSEEDRLVITEPQGRESRWDWLSWGLDLISP